MKILGIDTSGKIASVALYDDGIIKAQTTIVTKLTHSQIILPLVERTLNDAALTVNDIDCFAVANGPGSYTGLRIGISAVKALSFSLNKKCIGISTLESLAYNCICKDAVIIPVMKARPEVVYWAAFKCKDFKLQRLTDDKVDNSEELKKYIDTLQDNIIFTGDGADEFILSLNSSNDKVNLCPSTQLLQNAASLCIIASLNENKMTTPDDLTVSYLQITKAEKDLKQKEENML